MIQQNYL